MIAILEKYKLNQDFHQIVDFIEASHIRYALTFNPTVYVSHIRQFWSTARIETTEEGTKILATVDSKLRTVSESSIRRNLKLNDEAGIRDGSQGEACSTVTGLVVGQDRANIIKTSTLPSDSTPRVTSFAANEGNAPIKGRSLDEEEATAAKRSTERGSDDTEEMVNVLTSLDAAKILTSRGVQVSISHAVEFATATISIPTGSGSIPTASSPGTGIPTSSGMVLTASLIFTTATESTPYTRRKGKEKMVESDTPKKKKLQKQIDIARDAEIARIHAEEELQMMIDGLDMNNETVAKYLQEYHQFAAELPIGRRIELISDLVKYQDNYAKKKVKDSREKGLRLEQDSSKKLKTSEEVPEEKLKEMMELIPVEEVYMKLWALVKETLNIRPTTNDKEKELWVELKRLYEPDVEDLLWTHTQNLMHAPVEWKLYDTCGVHHVISKDQEIFMLVENDYPLRKDLAIVMISYKL
nr:xylulose kinase-1 [Tanacetum cinerariifolium]